MESFIVLSECSHKMESLVLLNHWAIWLTDLVNVVWSSWHKGKNNVSGVASLLLDGHQAKLVDKEVSEDVPLLRLCRADA